MVVASAFWFSLLLYGVGAGIAVFVPRTRIALAASTAGGVLAGGLAVLAGGGILMGVFTPSGQLQTGLPWGPLTLAPDALGGFFLVVIGGVSLATCLYSAGYLSHYSRANSLRRSLVFFHLLLLCLVLIVAAADAVTFLIAWETMSFLSYLAVILEEDNPSVAHAAYVMLAVGELGIIGIAGAFFFLGSAGGGFSFAALRLGANRLPPSMRSVVFLLGFLGFGAKAGLLPLQFWLPEAHPAAPSHVSAVLSAVVVKMGLYGIMRVTVDLLGPGPVWWGLLALGLGAVTALVGILHALVERDLKRILAYSTIENDGLIVAAVGMALTDRAAGVTVLAAIAGLFALYHLLNHAVAKALLFLGAGAVEVAAGTRDLERLGGVVRRMPGGAVLFLVGALAIAAVAPFAGYISEWSILETMLQSFALPDVSARLAIAVAEAVLALTAALAVMVFVRVYGIGFLGAARSAEAAGAREVAGPMRWGMGLLAVVSMGLGILPAFVVTVLDHISPRLWGASVVGRVVPPLFTDQPGEYAPLVALGGGVFRGLPVNGLVVIPAPGLTTITSPTYLVLGEVLLLGAVLGVVRLISGGRVERRGPVWAGGIPQFTARMQYGAVAYSNPARLIFNGLYRSRAKLVPIATAARHGTGAIAYTQEVPPPLAAVLYRPVRRVEAVVAEWVRLIQSGSVNQYVLYIFAIVLLVLVLQGANWATWLTYGLYLVVAGIVLLILRAVRQIDMPLGRGESEQSH
jgi:hydrogenase-4 component B